MTERIITDGNGRKHITNEPQLHPSKRTWVGLTNGEMIELSEMKLGSWDLILEVEAKLKDKNTGR